MSSRTQCISVFEHETLMLGDGRQHALCPKQLQAMQEFHGTKGLPYYSLVHNGVRFNEFVGVLQVGPTVIEVLPKVGKATDVEPWRKSLISMLHAVGAFDVHAPSSSQLMLKANSLLDLYFELFVNEVEYLLHRGLVKKYRKQEGNQTALKGAIVFPKHLRHNVVHQERFYVKHSVYDKEHQIHAILYKALQLVDRIHHNPSLVGRLKSLILDFPEQRDLPVSERTFRRLVLDRKTSPYKSALEIAKLLLLNHHPDVRAGMDDVLAIMFDMNLLWERFVYASLRRHGPPDLAVTGQRSKRFWKRDGAGYPSRICPDIVVSIDGARLVLDTKWKNVSGRNPSPEDLRQLFAYLKYFQAEKVALVYPGPGDATYRGNYYKVDDNRVPGEEQCAVITIEVKEDIRAWQQAICDQVRDWCSEG